MHIQNTSRESLEVSPKQTFTLPKERVELFGDRYQRRLPTVRRRPRLMAQPPSPRFVAEFREILDAMTGLNCPVPDLIEVPGLQNAMAFHREAVRGGRLYAVPTIAYDPSMLRRIEQQSGSKLAAQIILAHELGHHFYGHTLPSNFTARFQHPWSREHQADHFAGFVAARLGASERDFISVAAVTFSRFGSQTHPDVNTRIKSLAQGWAAGGGRKRVQHQAPPDLVERLRQAFRRYGLI